MKAMALYLFTIIGSFFENTPECLRVFVILLPVGIPIIIILLIEYLIKSN